MTGNIFEVVTRNEPEEVRLCPGCGVGLLAGSVLYRLNILFLSFR